MFDLLFLDSIINLTDTETAIIIATMATVTFSISLFITIIVRKFIKGVKKGVKRCFGY